MYKGNNSTRTLRTGSTTWLVFLIQSHTVIMTNGQPLNLTLSSVLHGRIRAELFRYFWSARHAGGFAVRGWESEMWMPGAPIHAH